MVLDLVSKFTNFKFICPLTPRPIQVIIHVNFSYVHNHFNFDILCKIVNLTTPKILPYLPGTKFCAIGSVIVKTEGSKNFRVAVTARSNITYLVEVLNF